MKITFWGTRGSIPTPMTAEEFRVKAKRLLMNAGEVDLNDESAVDKYLDSRPVPEAMTFGGNTPCVEITEGDSRLILDCGSGMFTLGRHLMSSGFVSGQRIDILQTHTHWDHMMGFPFFAPAYTPDTEIHIHGVHPGLKERFDQQMDLVHFPITIEDMAARIEFHELESGKEIELGPFSIRNKILHHPGGSYSYRISAGGSSIVYATDGEYKSPTEEYLLPFINFFKKADILIFDSMYSTIEKVIEKENYGHSAPMIGIDLALRAEVAKIVLFHHDPECNDIQIARSYERARTYLETRLRSLSSTFLELVAAYDGLELFV